jgi:hypothetical protein
MDFLLVFTEASGASLACHCWMGRDEEACHCCMGRDEEACHCCMERDEEACHCWMGRGCLGCADTKVGMLFRYGYQNSIMQTDVHLTVHRSIAGVWGWQVGRPPQAPLLRATRASGLRSSVWVCQAIFSGKLEMLIQAPFKILQGQIP